MSTSAEQRRIPRVAGALALLALQLGGALLVLRADPDAPARPGWRIPSRIADALGNVEHFGDDVIVLTTSQGPMTVRVDASTAVTTLTTPATLADVRPGDTILVWGRDPARLILVGGPAS
jgi:hypothetical protein